MDNVGIVVWFLDTAIAFFVELGMKLEGRATIEGEWARLRTHGAQLVGDVVQYADSCRLCYIRGPEGLLIGLAEQLGQSVPGQPQKCTCRAASERSLGYVHRQRTTGCSGGPAARPAAEPERHADEWKAWRLCRPGAIVRCMKGRMGPVGWEALEQ